jgi:hypothetical protein
MIAIEFDSALLGEVGSREVDGEYTRLFRQRHLMSLGGQIDLGTEASQSKDLRWIVPLEQASAFTNALHMFAWANSALKL